MGAKIEKAIRESDLGLNPASMGDLIRVPMPPMSEERRKEMTKLVRHEGETAKIAMRNLRRDANEHVKKLVKDKLASEDDQKRAEADIQKVTDRHIAEIDQLVTGKEAGDHGGLKCPQRPAAFTAMTHTPNARPVPHHVAIVMDGNGRWATRRYLPRVAGHKKGVDALRRLREALRRTRRQGADGVRFLLRELEPPGGGGFRPDGTAGGGAGARGAAAERGGRAHPLRRRPHAACRKRCGPAWRRPRRRPPRNHAPACSTSASTTAGAGTSPRRQHGWRRAAKPSPSKAWTAPWRWRMCRDPDLLIRTGGEQRLSNFLLWQAAYSELYFSDKLWPEFDAAALDEAIADYAARERRFGKTSEQVTSRPTAKTRARKIGLQSADAQATRHHRRRPAGHPVAGAVLAVARPLCRRHACCCIAAGAWEWGRLNGWARAARWRRRSHVWPCAARPGGWVLLERPMPLLWIGRRRALGAGGRLAAARRRGGLAAHPAGTAARRRRAGPVAGLAGGGRRHACSASTSCCRCWCWSGWRTSFAYFAGRAFGLKFTKSKLAPTISPGKSWEGVWGGMAGVLVLAFAWTWATAARQAGVPSLYTRLAERGLVVAGDRRCVPGSHERRRRPGRVADQAQRRRQGLQPPAARAMAACSIGWTRCCPPCPWP